MQPEAPALLWHARRAAGLTLDFIRVRALVDILDRLLEEAPEV
jgi:hypothetical protein